MKKSHKIKSLTDFSHPAEAEPEAEQPTARELQAAHRELHKLPEISAKQTEGGWLIIGQTDRAKTWCANYFSGLPAERQVRRITPGLFALTATQFATFCRAIPQEFLLGVQEIARPEVHSAGRIARGEGVKEMLAGR